MLSINPVKLNHRCNVVVEDSLSSAMLLLALRIRQFASCSTLRGTPHQEYATRELVASIFIVFQVSYQEQGDPTMETPKAQARRKQLQSHPGIQDGINRVWPFYRLPEHQHIAV